MKKRIKKIMEETYSLNLEAAESERTAEQAKYQQKRNLEDLATEINEIAKNPKAYAADNPVLLSLYDCIVRGSKIKGANGEWADPVRSFLLAGDAILEEYNRINALEGRWARLNLRWQINDNPETTRMDVGYIQGTRVTSKGPVVLLLTEKGSDQYLLDNLLTVNSWGDGLLDMEVDGSEYCCSLGRIHFPSGPLRSQIGIAGKAMDIYLKTRNSRYYR